MPAVVRAWLEACTTTTEASLPPPPDEAALEALPLAARDAWQQFVEGIGRGLDPRAAAARALSLPERAWARAPSPVVARLLHEGTYPVRLMQLDPTLLDRLGHEELELTRPALREEIRKLLAKHGVDEAVARVRNAVYLELARAEIDGCALEQVGPPLEALVGASLDVALDTRRPGLAEQVAIFAMGKLAGGELNYLSDVDFIFVHEDDDDASTASEQHARRMRVHDDLRAVLRMLEGPPRWRPVFRVDLRLRPFGSRGPLSLSAAATVRYYEAHGRDWERQVWLRATPLAGNLELGQRVVRALNPFVYRRTLGPEIFDEVEAIMARARRESRRNRLEAEGVDLKLDRGGIREIEFFVQALALMHAGRRPELRSPSTLSSLDRLAAAGLLSDHEHRVLVDGYRWLRRVEHRVQLGDGQQTHRVPSDPRALDALAHRLYDSGDLDAPGAEALRQRLVRTRSEVCEVTALFGDEEAPQRPPEARRSWARDVILDEGSPRALTIDALSSLGVRDPDEAAALLAHLDSRPDGPWKERGAARKGANRLLLACLDSADPDGALRRLAEFAARRPAHYALWRHLAEPSQRELVQRMADLFGASEALSRGLIGSSGAADDDGALRLLLASHDAGLPTSKDLARAWEPHALGLAKLTDPRAQGEELRRELLVFKAEQFVRIGSHDFARAPDPIEVGRALSRLADHIVAALAGSVAGAAAQDAKLQQAGLTSLTIVAFAMGKYGMEAMDYGSDLDLFFVFDGRGPGPLTHPASRLARRFISQLQGSSARDRLYEVDMRLRPSGGQGLLVSGLDGFRSYHAKGLPVWERLAMLRARPVAHMQLGSEAPDPGALAAQVEAILQRSCIGNDDASHLSPDHVATQVRDLKARIERELSRETRMTRDVKTGRGGVLEFELLVGALQLIHSHAGAAAPAGAPPREGAKDVLHALSALADAGHVPGERARALAESYRFMRRLLNRLRMQSVGSAAHNPDRFDINSPRLSALARRMGVASDEALVDAHARHAQRIRDAFEAYLPS